MNNASRFRNIPLYAPRLMAKRFSLVIFLMALLAVACGSQSTATPIPPPTPTFAPPAITHELQVRVDPREAAQVLLNPLPLEQSRYLSGRTVTIDVLPNPGWRVTDWAGPVHDVAGETAKTTMNSSQTIIVRLTREGGTAGGAGQVPSSGRPIFIGGIEALGEAVGSEDSNAVFLVSIVDGTGDPVAGAEFTGQIVTPSGNRTTGGTTGADGVGKVVVPVSADGQFKFEVTDITGTGLSYQPALNNVVQAIMQSNSAAFTITASSGKSGTIATFKVTTNRPLGDWIVKKKGGGTTKKGNFKGKALTSSFTRTMTGCKPDVKEYTATIRTLFGLVTKDASFTITAPPCKEGQKVHVERIDADYVILDNKNTEMTFLVDVAEEDHSLISGEPVTVTGVIEGPGGFVNRVDGLTDVNGRAIFQILVSESGTYSLTISGMSGGGVQYDPGADESNIRELQVSAGSEYTLAEDETQRITAEIRWGWSYVPADESDDEIPYLLAALDIFGWEDNLNNDDPADVTGFATVIIDGSGDDGAISIDDLEEIMADESILPDNCQELADSALVDEYLGFGIMNTYFCDEGGIYAFRVYSQPESVSILMVMARLLTEQDEVDFSVFEQTLEWVPSFLAKGAGRQVHLTQPVLYFDPIASDSDYFTLEFLVEVVDSNEEFVSGVTISGYYEDPNGNTFPFETTEPDPNTVPEFRVDVYDKGIYTFVVTDVTGPDISYDPELNQRGDTVQQLVQASVTVEVIFDDEGISLPGIVLASVPETWIGVRTDLTYFEARSEDIDPWIENLTLGMPITRAGLSVQVIEVPSSTTLVNESYLEGILNGTPAPPNCESTPERFPRENNGRVDEIEDLFRCDSDAITYYNVVKYDPSNPEAVLLIRASGVQGMDFTFFRNFLSSVRWQPLGSGSQRTVYLSRDSGAGYDHQTGEVWLTVAVVDGGESVYVDEFSVLILGPDGPDAFPYESTTGTLTFDASFPPGVYEFTVTGVGIEGTTFDPTRS